MHITERIAEARIVPVIAIHNVDHAIPLCEALEAGGLKVAEITFRTAAAPEAIRIVADRFPDFALGAGTITTIENLEAAKEAGAQFAVAPGMNPRIVRRAQEIDLPFYPGVCTPSEIEAALELGCKLLKFFPAGAMGGIPTLKALNGPYAHLGVGFIATGGVSPKNLAEYLACPGVTAIGGSWLATKDLIAAEDWAGIAERTRVAVEIADSLSQ